MILIVILIMMATIGSATISDPMVWPAYFHDSEDFLKFIVYNTNETEHVRVFIKCGSQTMALEEIYSHNVTQSLKMSMVRFKESDCPQDYKDLTVVIAGERTRFKKVHQVSLEHDFDHETAAWVSHCPKSGHKMILTFPCFAKDVAGRFCNQLNFCGGKLVEKGPEQCQHLTGMPPVCKEKQMKCFEVPVKHVEHSCVSTADSHSSKIKASEEYTPESFCKIHKSVMSGSDFEVTIPAMDGVKVCVNWRLHDKSLQNCNQAENGISKIKIPRQAHNLVISCEGSRHQLYQFEGADIYCPIIGSEELSVNICKTVYRPVLFWMSILWAITGLPFTFCVIYVIKKLVRLHKYRGIVGSRKDRCKHCNVVINNNIEAGMHEKCLDHFCPFCQSYRPGRDDFLYHVRNCPSKIDEMKKIGELTSWQWSVANLSCDSVTVYQSKSTRIIWISLFFVIFVSMFTPSIAESREVMRDRIVVKFIESCSYMNGLMENTHDKFERNNDEVSWGTPTDADMDEEIKDVDIPDTEFGDAAIVLDLMAEEFKKVNIKLEEVSKALQMAGMEQVILEMSTKLQSSMNNLIQSLTSEKGPCNEMIKININNILPITVQKTEYDSLRVHRDDAIKIRMLVNSLNVPFENSVRGPGSTITGGEDSVLQVGRDNLHAAGGSGSGKQIGLGGSTNIIVDDNLSTNRTSIQRPHVQHQPAANRQRHGRYDRLKARYNSRKLQSIDDIDDQTNEISVREKIQRTIREKNRTKQHFLSRPFNPAQIKTKMVRTKKGKTTATIRTMHNHHGFSKENQAKDFMQPNNKWWDFSHESDPVCQVSCLHEPETCECVSDNLPASGKFELPWTSLAVTDIRTAETAQKYIDVSVSLEFDEGSRIKTKSVMSGVLDLHEESAISWRLKHKDSEEMPIVSMVIPRITQVYETNFMYFTCERQIAPQVKFACTGDCGEYCNGKVCLGTQIWKFDSCATWGCEPGWCANINGGCCCCGSTVTCPLMGKIGALWEVKYMRTEILVCIIFNDRLQNCKLADSSTELTFGNVEVGISRVIDSVERLGKYVFTVVKPVDPTRLNAGLAAEFRDPIDIFLNPPTCLGAQSCGHGMIGDLQINNFTCIHKVGNQCADSEKELHSLGCSENVYMNHANTNMRMACHSLDYHSCHHDNAVKEVKFNEQLKNTEKLSKRFTERKVRVNLQKKELLLYVTPKQGSGTISFQVTANEIFLNKPDSKPSVEIFNIKSCEGCFSCLKGFYCNAEIKLDKDKSYTIEAKSSTPEVEVASKSITIHPFSNEVMIKLIAYSEIKSVRICLFYGETQLNCNEKETDLHEPEGVFVPAFKSIDSENPNEGVPKCLGFDWFSCAGNSIKSFFSNIGNLLSKFWWAVILVLILIVAVFFAPIILTGIKACFSILKSVKPKKGLVKRSQAQDSFKKMKSQMTKYEKVKKDDTDLGDVVQLMAFDNDYQQ